MYAFYSLLIYIFYSLFRRDGGAAASADPGNPAGDPRPPGNGSAGLRSVGSRALTRGRDHVDDPVSDVGS